MKRLHAIVAPLGNRLKLLASTCRILGTSLRGGVIVCQTSLLRDETRDGLQLVQQPGLRSRPPDGSGAVVVFPAGDRGNGLVIGVHDGQSDTELLPGETELYAQGGAALRLRRGRQVEVEGDVAGDGNIADWRGSLELIRELFDSHVHPSAAGPTGPPTVPMRAEAGGGEDGGEETIQFVEVGTGPPPPPSSRVKGARYLDVGSGEVYELAESWSAVGSLQGPQGSLWLTGEGEPPGPSGREGDLYLDTLSGDVYSRDMHGWTLEASLLGPPGTTDHGEQTGLGDDDHPQYLTEDRALDWLESRSADDLPEGSTHLYLTPDERTKLEGGAGSGLDADTLRGNPPAAFALAVHTHVGGDIDGGVIDGGTP